MKDYQYSISSAVDCRENCDAIRIILNNYDVFSKGSWNYYSVDYKPIDNK